MLSALQWQLLDLVVPLRAAERFALAGGAALILRGTVDRRDLDSFIGYRDMPPGAITEVVEATESALLL